MRTNLVSIALGLTLAAAVAASPAHAAALRVIASDARGVTLQVSAGTWSLSAPAPDGRVTVLGVPEAHSLADPGHGLLPAYATMLAVPLDARPTVRVLTSSATESRDGVRLAIARKPVFRPDARGELEPAAEDVTPITDGLWPKEPVQLGAPTPFRGRRLVGIEVRPYQYDEALGRLVVTPGMTVRVDFNRPAGASALSATSSAPDPHADAVLGSSVLNFEQGRPWRAAPAGDPAAATLFGASRRAASPGAATAELAFDESQPEVRVKLDSTALYALPFDELGPKGYPAGIPIAQVSVHRHEFTEGAATPYATIEQPCEVDDVNGNGVFDTGDRVWVYSRTWAARSGASYRQRWWGDAEVVFVTVKPAGGLRVPQRAGWRGQAGLTPLSSYPYQQHWEVNSQRIMPVVSATSDTAIDLYHWTDITFYNDRPDTITFTVNDIDTTHAAQFRSAWMGRALNTHFMWAQVKNSRGAVTTVVDSLYWYGKREQLANTALNGSAFSEGTNRFLDWGKTDAAPYDPVNNNKANVGLNWFETTYWRRFKAVHDMLPFNTAGATGEIQLHGTGFTSDSIRVWDVTQPESPVRVVPDAGHLGGGAFDIQDLVGAGETHQYVAASFVDPLEPDYGPRVPPSASFSPVHRGPVYANTAGDYLMVVGDSTWLLAVQPLVNLRRAQGLSVVVATAQQVYDEFNGGRHSAAAIQRFTAYAYAHWSTRFMLLVGDGTLDPLNHIGNAGTDWLPVVPIPGPVSIPEGFEVTVSDNYYGCITGNCDPIYGSGAVIPEIMIGRLPVNSVTDVQNVVAKIVNYEDLSGDQSWRLHTMLVSDDSYSSDGGFGVGSGVNSYCWKDWEEHFVGLNNKVRSVMVDSAGLTQMNVERFNLRSYITTGYVVNGPRDTCRADRNATRTLTHNSVTPTMFSHMNGGTLWVNYQGHANEYVLTHEDLYVNSGDFAGSDDRFLFHNDGKPILWTAFSCHASMFARPEGGPTSFFGGCIGEDMVTLPRGGAVATWASACYEVVPRDDVTHLNVAVADAMFANPPNDPLLSGGSRVILGEAIEAAFIRFMPKVSSYQSERGTPLTYTLLGDPAQRISIGQPQTVVRANDTLVVDAQPVRLHSPLDTLTLVADLVSTAQLDSIRLYRRVGSTETRIVLDSTAFVPAYPDTAGGGLYGGRRYRVTHRDHLLRRTHAYIYRITDHDGLTSTFTVPFQLAGTLRANGQALAEMAEVAPGAALSYALVSPAPIDPTTDLSLSINGVSQDFTPTRAAGDLSGREWLLSWTHPDYPLGRHDLALAIAGGDSLHQAFRVASGNLALKDLLAFPNPFDNDGTRFSFNLLGSDAADLRITVLTVSGRRIWSGDWRSLSPGYHQIPWDGRDAEGSVIANGTYLIHATAVSAGGQRIEQFGRMVKLRRPRHVDIVDPAATP